MRSSLTAPHFKITTNFDSIQKNYNRKSEIKMRKNRYMKNLIYNKDADKKLLIFLYESTDKQPSRKQIPYYLV